MGDVRNKRIVRVGVGEHRADGQQHYSVFSHIMIASRGRLRTFRDGKRWRPLVPQNVQADRPVRIDIRVVDLGREADLGRLEGVVGREGNGKEEDAAGVRRVALEQ